MFKIRKIKNKLKIRRRLKKDAAAAANVTHEVIGLVSLERVISNAFVGAALEMNTLAASMGNMSVQQGPRGVDRGRHQSFFTLNPPQGNPFAAAGAAKYSWTAHLPSAFPLYPATSFTMDKAAKIKFKVRKFLAKIKVRRLLAKDANAADVTCSPRALVALESQLVRLCEICTVCLGLNGVQVNAYSVELAHSDELRLQRNRDFDG
ncbi:hypothetical protein J7337_009997 [Fusarium musae]|uniref:Uncharacterized protein n=1 Tax=Fusarium musae TaxID=1042133 RepID=A0A9P8DC19_9HYPO|nr:hypothetical protein J7337_009997 [Fusarium musae]KAG9499179.1 hypothetical protein J7337_009997 [Fusarium musae]